MLSARFLSCLSVCLSVTQLNSTSIYGRRCKTPQCTHLSSHFCISSTSINLIRALWPNGWTDQDETWQAGRPRPGHAVLDGNPAPLPKKGAEPPIFGPYLLWPNGCMDRDATWYGARPRPRRLCVKWGPSPPKFSAHVYYSYCDFITLKHCTVVVGSFKFTF